MANNKFSNLFNDNTNVYLIVIALFVISSFFQNIIVGIIGSLVLLYLLFFNWRQQRVKNKKWERYIESLSSEMDSASRHAILNLPIPLILVDFDGQISWYNSKFSDMVDDKSLLNQNINQVFNNLTIDDLVRGKGTENVKIGDRTYTVLNNIVKLDEVKGDNRYIIMLYWIDNTEYFNLKSIYEDEKTVVALVQVDNYDDVMNETKEEKIPFVKSEIEKKINLWASRMNGLIKKYQSDRYLVVFEQKYLENLEAKRFAILDDVREIEEGNKIPVTLSIGIGRNGKNMQKLEEEAFAALELALGRGGDQAVVRKNNNFAYYGGKTKAVEKRNRVKARIIAHGFRPLIDESSKVIIMGHKNPDMDSFGSAIGVLRAVLNRGKDGYIVLNKISEPIRNIYEAFKANDKYKFITYEEADELVDENTLLVVVDTHRPASTEYPELLERIDRVVLFDHHRRGTDFIDNTALKYLEPYASSTSELVAEILQYMENKMTLEKLEAEALLAGIAVDTKSFSQRTGVRTFEAASLLRRYGADTTVVRQFFQDDLSTHITRSNVVTHAKIYYNDIAISTMPDIIENAQLVAAQSADNLLNIRGIMTSFVILKKNEDEVIVSARSLDQVNVQLVLEKIGGGGHRTVAGAQFMDKDIDEVKSMLLDAIEEYFQEGD